MRFVFTGSKYKITLDFDPNEFMKEYESKRQGFISENTELKAEVGRLQRQVSNLEAKLKESS